MSLRFKRRLGAADADDRVVLGEDVLAAPNNGVLQVTVAHKDGSAAAVLRLSFEDAADWLRHNWVFVGPPSIEYPVHEVRSLRVRHGRKEVKVCYQGFVCEGWFWRPAAGFFTDAHEDPVVKAFLDARGEGL
jgi:hypothetical protein